MNAWFWVSICIRCNGFRAPSDTENIHKEFVLELIGWNSCSVEDVQDHHKTNYFQHDLLQSPGLQRLISSFTPIVPPSWQSTCYLKSPYLHLCIHILCSKYYRKTPVSSNYTSWFLLTNDTLWYSHGIVTRLGIPWPVQFVIGNRRTISCHIIFYPPQ